MERATQRGIMRVVEPLFPCYLFVRCLLAESMESIRHVAGISSLVHFGQRIPIVPDGAIEELRQCFESEEPMAVQDGLVAGAEVTIAEGCVLGVLGDGGSGITSREKGTNPAGFPGSTNLGRSGSKLVEVVTSTSGRSPALISVNVVR